MIGIGIAHLKPSGKYVPPSMTLKIVHFACTGISLFPVIDTVCTDYFLKQKFCVKLYSAVTASVPYSVQ